MLLLYGAISVTLQRFTMSLLRTTFHVVRMFYSCKTFIQRACDHFFKFTIVAHVKTRPEAHSCVQLVIYI